MFALIHKFKSTKILFSLIALLFVGYVSAQTPQFTSYNLGQGKRTISVFSMAQDQNNRMYFGTEKGVVLYDGLVFKDISFHDTLSTHAVSAMASSNGNIWAGTKSGAVYLLKEGRFEPFQLSGLENEAGITTIYSFEDLIIIGTYGNGVFFVRDQTVSQLNTANGLSDDYTYDITAHNSMIWIGTDAGITQIDPKTLKANVVSMSNGLPDNIVTALLSRNDSIIALGTHDFGIVEINSKTGKITTLKVGEQQWERGPIEALIQDKQGDLWIATKDEGLLEISGKKGAPLIRAYSEIMGLNSNRITALLFDNEDNIWIATHKGLSLYTGSGCEFLGKADGLTGLNIYDVLVDRHGNKWLASDQGVMKFSYTSSGNGLIKNYLESDGSLDRQVVCLFETKDGNIWMGSYGSGVFILDPQTEKITNLGKSSGLPNTNVMSIEQDNSGRIWLATLGGSAVILNPTANGYEIKQISDFTHLKSEYIYTLFHDSQDQMWMGTDGAGVATFDCTNEYFKPGFGGILSDATIYSITEDQEGGMWFATADKGLFRYFKGSLKEYGTEAGLRSNAVIALKTGEKGQLIAIHLLGIDVLSAGESVFMNYNIDKLGFNFEPNMNAICVDGADFWIGTEDGAVKCVLADEREKTITPKVLITELRVLYEPRELNQGAEFGYGENHFVFDFQAIWLKNPGSVRYKFMLDGFDKDWSFETESRIATYSSLPPGEYTFKVVATNGNGQWSDEQESSYSFVILRPFWMQWWFYVLVFAVSATVVVYYIRWRTQKLIEDKKFLEAEVARRTEEISHQKDIIEEKNHEILDSINYAKRIQTAILPPDRLFKRHLPNAFVLYKPKDIVAGDFYWMQALDDIEDENHQSPVLFAAADCTGHGVPGAMVSVVCNNALNRAIREFGFTEPAQILNIVRTLVIEEFEKSEEDVKDGMDIALCAWDPKERVLQYAGAQNPLWIVTKRDLSLPSAKEPTVMADWKLFEIKPDKQPIGKYAETHPFTNHQVHLAQGDSIYIFSDGYADQFGGDKGKKFKCSSMKELILSIQDKPMDTQKTIINAHFESWRGELEQVDDVCVIGLRV